MIRARSIGVSFVPRETPLAPVAAACVGTAARGLGERLSRMDEEALSRLEGVAGRDVLIVLGDAEHLPWAPEVVYLGWDPHAPRLLLPTALRPDVPADVLQRAILSRAPERPVAVLPSPRRIVPVATAVRVERSVLGEWLSRWA